MMRFTATIAAAASLLLGACGGIVSSQHLPPTTVCRYVPGPQQYDPWAEDHCSVYARVEQIVVQGNAAPGNIVQIDFVILDGKNPGLRVKTILVPNDVMATPMLSIFMDAFARGRSVSISPAINSVIVPPDTPTDGLPQVSIGEVATGH